MKPIANDIFKPGTFSVYEFLGPENRGFIIPIYQRSYSWKTDTFKELVSDIVNGLLHLTSSNNQKDEFTYIGGIITTDGERLAKEYNSTRVPEKILSLVDGQQRISTLVIIALELLPEVDNFINNIKKDFDNESEEIKTILKFLIETLNKLEKITTGKHLDNNETFPKVIRISEDRWTNNSQEIISPVGKMIVELAKSKVDNGNFASYRPKRLSKGNHPLLRFNDLKTEIANYIRNPEGSIFDKIPDLTFFENVNFIYDEIFENKIKDINFILSNENSFYYQKIFNISIFAYYFLNRVALTQLNGTSEYFAFEVFESLNTTGEPLNAYETLKPLVIKDFGATYANSLAKIHIDKIDKVHASVDKIENKQTLVSSSIIMFANTELGIPLSKSFGSQSKAIRESYNISENGDLNDLNDKIKYLHLLSNVTEITALISGKKIINDNLSNLPALLDDESKLCFAFLIDLKHTMALSILARFYYEFNLENTSVQVIDLNNVVKALAAFAALWRAAWGGTAGIDGIYRNLMSEPGNYARRKSANIVIKSVDLKNQLLNILFNNKGLDGGKIINKDNWIDLSGKVPIFMRNKKVTKFLLLAAQHDSTPDPSSPGMILSGNKGIHDCFNYDSYMSDSNYTVEHIAPQSNNGRWRTDLYDNSYINILGNLILLPTIENSILNNRSWDQKKIIYSALSRLTPHERKKEINTIIPPLNNESRTSIENASYMPTLDAISRVNDWNMQIVRSRTDQLLNRSFERLLRWLS